MWPVAWTCAPKPGARRIGRAVAEFRKRHEAALTDLFTSVLSLCKEAGLVKVGVIAMERRRGVRRRMASLWTQTKAMNR